MNGYYTRKKIIRQCVVAAQSLKCVNLRKLRLIGFLIGNRLIYNSISQMIIIYIETQSLYDENHISNPMAYILIQAFIYLYNISTQKKCNGPR